MELTLTDTQTALHQAVAGSITRDAPVDVIRRWLDDGELDRAYRLATRQGWTGIGLSEEAGGQGGGVQDLALVAEQLGRGAVPWDQMLATWLIIPMLSVMGSRGSELAEAGARGETRTALCIDARSPVLGDLEVERDGGPVNGTVRFVLGATDADIYIVPRRVADADEVELLEVARGAEGVLVTPRHLIDTTRSLADVTLSGAMCRSLGSVPMSTVRHAVHAGIVLTCADMLGAASQLLEMTTAYVKDRRQFDVPVGSFQAVKHAAAQMLVDVEGMRSAVQYSAWAVETEVEDAGLQASVAGTYCSASAPAVADRALFLHGAIGYTWEHDLHLWFKRVKSGASLFGTADWHREKVCIALES